MKAHCGHGLRTIVAAALLTGVALGHAQAQQEKPAAQVSETSDHSAAVPSETVVAVRIVTEDGRMLSEKTAGLAISVGKPLDREQVAESIRALYRTGDYADVRAVSTPVDGGVRVDFVVREQLFFNQVIIRGLVSPPTEASAIAAVQLPLGEPYQPEAVNEGLERRRGGTRARGGGWREKGEGDMKREEVAAEKTPHNPKPHQMDVIINIQAGKR